MTKKTPPAWATSWIWCNINLFDRLHSISGLTPSDRWVDFTNVVISSIILPVENFFQLLYIMWEVLVKPAGWATHRHVFWTCLFTFWWKGFVLLSALRKKGRPKCVCIQWRSFCLPDCLTFFYWEKQTVPTLFNCLSLACIFFNTLHIFKWQVH